VDSIANHGDAFFAGTRSVALDMSALLFSVSSDSGILAPAVPGTSPILYEPTAPAGGSGAGGVWAIPPLINHPHAGGALPNQIGGDLDGLEVWGGDGAAADDSDRFSLLGDPFNSTLTRTSVYAQIGGPGGAVTPLVDSGTIAALIAPTLSLPPGFSVAELARLLDLDGLMMWDDDDSVITPGDAGNIASGPDHMLFSIRPISITDPAGGTIVITDGGEIWETNFAVADFLAHGGHKWDTLFDVKGTFRTLDENVDGLEAAAYIPEPGCATVLAGGAAGLATLRRRRRGRGRG
jgi:hypothetical protein